ncbi:MAG: hypothetical protein ACQEP9_10135 [Bacillota bacterium]
MKKAILLLSLLIVLVTNSPLFAAQGEPFSIAADGYVIFNEATNVIEAQDNVVIKSGADEIKADSIVANLDEKTIKAGGNVLLIQDDQKLRGSQLEYNYQSQQAEFHDAQMQEDKLNFSGEVIKLVDERVTIENSKITACKRQDPHYHISAEEIEVKSSGKIIATDVYLWVKGRKIMPLPKYVTNTDQQKRKENAIPKPELGYNRTDGAYLSFDYDHYINDSLEGNIFAKVAQKSTDRLKLDYDYQPSETTNLQSYLYYKRNLGLSGNLALDNDFGSVGSQFRFDSVVETDEDEPDYKENTSQFKWDVTTDLADLKLEAKKDPEDETGTDKRVMLKNDWSDYYWQIQASTDSAVNYRPEVEAGIKNKALTENIDLSAGAKAGRIYEAETEVDTSRQELNLALDHSGYSLSDSIEVYGSGDFSTASYDTPDSYQSYGFNLGSNQDLLGADLNLDYQYYNTAGTTPFEFDRLTDIDLGERHYLTTVLSDRWQLSDDFGLGWELRGSKNYYQTRRNYLNYGMLLNTDYQINDYNRVELAYRYQNQNYDSAPLDADETEWQNELELTYGFVTDKREFPYWDVEVNTLYDFTAGADEREFKELNFDLKREFDCFNVSLGLDVPERGIDFGIDVKY